MSTNLVIKLNRWNIELKARAEVLERELESSRGRNRGSLVTIEELEARVAELQNKLQSRPLPMRRCGFKILALVEVEADEHGGWVLDDCVSISDDCSYGWIPHPSTASGQAFHGRSGEGGTNG